MVGYVWDMWKSLKQMYEHIQIYSTQQINIINKSESMQTKTKQNQPYSFKTKTIKHNNIWPDVK